MGPSTEVRQEFLDSALRRTYDACIAGKFPTWDRFSQALAGTGFHPAQ